MKILTRGRKVLCCTILKITKLIHEPGHHQERSEILVENFKCLIQSMQARLPTKNAFGLQFTVTFFQAYYKRASNDRFVRLNTSSDARSQGGFSSRVPLLLAVFTITFIFQNLGFRF